MNTENKNIESLRNEYNQLNSSINRIGLLVIGLLALITFTLSGALDGKDFSNLEFELNEAKDAVENQRNLFFGGQNFETKINSILKNAENSNKNIVNSNLANNSSNNLNSTLNNNSSNNKSSLSNSASQSSVINSRQAAINEIYRERDEVNKKLEEATKKYNDYLEKSLTISPSLLGTGFKIYLVNWAYFIPFIFIIFQLYIFILLKKQKLLEFIINRLIEKEGGLTFDSIQFSADDSAYRKYPYQLNKILYWVSIIFLIGNLYFYSDYLTPPLTTTQVIQYFSMLFSLTVFSIIYYLYSSFSLRKQLFVLVRFSVSSNKLVKCLMNFLNKIVIVLFSIKPRASLVTYSLLILVSLFTSTLVSCENRLENRAGYEIFYGSKIYWVTSIIEGFEHDFQQLYWINSINTLGKSMYVLGIILAIVTIVFVFLSLRQYKIFYQKVFLAIITFLTSICCFFVIADFAFTTFWAKDELFFVSNLFWIIPSVILARYFMMSYRSNKKNNWRYIIILMFLPLVFNAIAYTIYVSVYFGLLGILFYFAGINLLFLTYFKTWQKLTQNKSII